MPVLECSCGMVMSVSAADPRICCIRCGGGEFRILGRRPTSTCAVERIEARPMVAAGTRPTMVLVQLDAASLAPVAGSC